MRSTATLVYTIGALSLVVLFVRPDHASAVFATQLVLTLAVLLERWLRGVWPRGGRR